MKRNPHRYGRSIAYLAALVVLLGFSGQVHIGRCDPGSPWTKTSKEPALPLAHPTVEEEIERRGGSPSGYRFVVFGDQRALADGEWQRLVSHIAHISRADEALLFILDTGDMVDDGTYSDQFHALKEILRPVSHLPYLVGVGNHEKNDNKGREALRNTAAFLSYLDAGIRPDRMYYRKDIGPVRFLFMDTNDLVYGDDGKGSSGVVTPGTRAERQMEWLVAELAGCGVDNVPTTIAVMHHPIIQSSIKHRHQAVALSNLEYNGITLAELLLGGGVDLILTGHTHTYERFVIRDLEGGRMCLVNVSGRPRGGFMWMGQAGFLWAGGVSRRAVDIAGREDSWFEDSGWKLPTGWRVSQADAMLQREADQFVIFTVEGDGGIVLEVAFLDEDAPTGLRWDPAVRVK